MRRHFTALLVGGALTMSVQPLRSGAPGGAWSTNKLKYRDGKPVVVSH